ncbi:MAG: beta-lactamase family protein [Tetrasphaera sp.]|nr:beta-lactamase family protein [Tetrasphaera sp.]
MVLPRTSATAVAVDPAGVLAFLDAADRAGLELHSVMMARRGQVFAEGWWEPYAADTVHLGYSLSKSFTATAIGVLVDEGRVGLDDPVVGFFPWIDASDVTPGYERLLVRHCLSMTTGHTEDMWTPTLVAPDDGRGDPDPAVRRILALPLPAEPGTVFTYNQVATYLLGAIIRAVTGGDILDLLRARVFGPLGWGEAAWHSTAYGAQLGFSGIHVTTETILGLAQLHLDHGVGPDGQRILSQTWVEEATRGTGAPRAVPDPEAGPDWNAGYGFSFWQARHGYRGDGAFGQYAIVLPEEEIAIAITSEVDDMQAVLDLLWTHVLPAVDRPGTPAGESALRRRLGILERPPLASTSVGEDGTWAMTDAFGLGQARGSVSVSRAVGGWLVTLDGSLGERPGRIALTVGDGAWLPGELVADGARLPVMACGSWTGSDFAADIRLVETPHTIRLRTRGDGAAFSWRYVPLSGPWPFALSVHREEA